MEKHIMGENGISYYFRRGRSVLSRPVPPGRDESIRLESMECCGKRI